ncbi:MAG: HipA family kinase [Asticcacaulis sp.]|uniref:HipA family kinase n=1 Tax=Asticcacaulis sp. TaxID=1872648 RepID=UPI003F7B7714
MEAALIGVGFLLRNAEAVELIRPTSVGRTGPLIIACELDNGDVVELVAKFSGRCEEGAIHLAREVIGASLAGYLGLPVPEPFFVNISDDWVSTIPDPTIRQNVLISSRTAFGSRLITGQYSIWSAGNIVTAAMLPMASAIFAFDAIVQNPDRRIGNPNCLVRGDQLRIFDHELAFSHRLLIGWQPPWALGSLQSFQNNGQHIFYHGLKGKNVDLQAIKAAWSALSDETIAGLADGLTGIWDNVNASVSDALTLIAGARDNIDGCITEIGRVLA